MARSGVDKRRDTICVVVLEAGLLQSGVEQRGWKTGDPHSATKNNFLVGAART